MKFTAFVFGLIASISIFGCKETVHFTIDAQQDVKPISPYIYGINQPLAGPYQNATLLRIGGNRWTAYNWTNNASNAGSDWYFENDGFLSDSLVPGAAVASHIDNASARHAAALVTIPINGYVAFDKNGDGDVRKSGDNYLQLRFHREAARKPTPFTLTPNPRDPVVYQDEFVNWIKERFPYCLTDPDRPIWFSLDNEPDLWTTTHKVIHPDPPTYEEVTTKAIDYASAIKGVMPNTLIFAPVNYGWQGFVRLQNAPDSENLDFQEYFLDQMRAAELTSHRRLLDVLDIHWYPEVYVGDSRIIDKVNTPALAQARIQAPRSLNDPTYIENSWIATKALNGPINLLPRLQQKIAAHYPGTKLAITEYNYGGGSDISGAIAQADVLGIFGTSSVFAACEWPLEPKEPFIAAAFQMYRDFDGSAGHFGDTSISARTDNLERSSVYASLDSAHPNQLLIIAINKTPRSLSADIQLLHQIAFRQVQVFCLTAAVPTPTAAPPLNPGNTKHFIYVMPPLSVTTLRLTGD